MVWIYLCDDNQSVLDKYEDIIQKAAGKHGYSIATKHFINGESLLFNLQDNPNEADIIYLDILMKDLNGIETAKKLRDYGCESEIIYLTASEDYVFNSFDVNAYNYILKDRITTDKFESILIKAINLAQRKKQEIFKCSRNHIIKHIPIHSISYFESSARLVTVHYDGKSFSFYSNMNTLMENLIDKGFIQCHRSYIVNMHFISELDKTDLILIDCTRIPLGSSYVREIKHAFALYLADSY